MILLSICLPVYNVEDYIRPCLESIFRQGLDEECFEVILINDGTKDNSMGVIQDIVSQHHNIIVVNQKNQGLSVVRNNGIGIAKGEYILMPDSDDLLIDNSLPPLLKEAISSKADLVVADFLKMDDEEIRHTDASSLQQKKFTYNKKTGEQLFLEDLNPYHCYVWRTLYRRAFLLENNIRFIPGIYIQDVPFTHECYLKANYCICTNIRLIIYRRWPGSATNAYKFDNTKHFITAIALTWRLRQIEGLTSDLLFKLEDNIYISFRTMIYHTLHSIKDKKDRFALIDYINFQAPDLNFSHSIRQRLTTMMIKRVPHLFIDLYYQYARIAYKNRH